jgi:hypothetical protein
MYSPCNFELHAGSIVVKKLILSTCLDFESQSSQKAEAILISVCNNTDTAAGIQRLSGSEGSIYRLGFTRRKSCVAYMKSRFVGGGAPV